MTQQKPNSCARAQYVRVLKSVWHKNYLMAQEVKAQVEHAVTLIHKRTQYMAQEWHNNNTTINCWMERSGTQTQQPYKGLCCCARARGLS